ncbi:MAG: Maebl [Sulfurovum sp. PC08-66]|nr:MAG: Maebl [Sulfurovum sp. PC08-66]KIM12508.1 MAG: Maebl [Sulfuricurvum sp. PC08-66]
MHQERLAVLIDADNSSAAAVEGLIAEIAKYGIASVKRIYGDWTDTRLKQWKAVLLEYSITPMQQFAYTTGKNATDSAMIIDAMDLLYTKNFDGFCIVSSDSDFTKLASRIREAGLKVYGFGEKKTPKPFVNAVDKFIYIENLQGDSAPVMHQNAQTAVVEKYDIRKDVKLLDLLRRAVEDSIDDTQWANLGRIGQHIANTTPDFDPRNYGYKKLSELLEATEKYEIKTRFDDEYGPHKSVYVRPKRASR